MPGSVLSGEEILDAGQAVDFVAPHSYSSNVRLGPDGQPAPYMSIMTQIALDAAATAVGRQPESTLVLTGETCYGDAMPTTTDLMVERAIAELGLSAERVEPLSRDDGRGLDNTYLQTEALAHFFADHDGRAVIMPLSYHLRRIMHTAEAYGIEADFVAAEDVLHAAGNHSYDRFLPRTHDLEASEKVLRAINMFDRRGRFLNFMMRAKGPRLVDVVESDEGLVLEQGYSADKLKAVTASSPPA